MLSYRTLGFSSRLPPPLSRLSILPSLSSPSIPLELCNTCS
uniref:Uncharacterized protein n=1 Tax=Arundo donax TaxID=35708 RepID=A0A0A9CB96_ARUDO